MIRLAGLQKVIGRNLVTDIEALPSDRATSLPPWAQLAAARNTCWSYSLDGPGRGTVRCAWWTLIRTQPQGWRPVLRRHALYTRQSPLASLFFHHSMWMVSVSTITCQSFYAQADPFALYV